MNKTLRILLASDFLMITGFGLIGPIFAIFVDKDVSSGDIFSAGMASFVFLAAQSICQLLLAKKIDMWETSKVIDYLIVGNILIATVPFVYMGWKDVTGIYLAELIYGIGSAFDHPCWLKLWSVYLDRDHESYEWSVYSVLTNIGQGVAALVGGYIAATAGFDVAFMIVGLFAILGTVILAGLRKTVILDSVKQSVYNVDK